LCDGFVVSAQTVYLFPLRRCLFFLPGKMIGIRQDDVTADVRRLSNQAQQKFINCFLEFALMVVGEPQGPWAREQLENPT
jgi:hypothetical protein